MLKQVPIRSKMDRKFTWNAESVFKTDKAWEKEVDQILQDLSSVKACQGHLAEGAPVLMEALSTAYALVQRAQTAVMYAAFSYAADTTNQQAAGMRGQRPGHVRTGPFGRFLPAA